MGDADASVPPAGGLEPDAVRRLLDVSRRIHAEVDPRAVLETVVDSLVQITRADRGFLLLESADGDLEFTIARDREGNSLSEDTFQISRGVVNEVAESGTTRLIDDAANTDVLQGRQSVIHLNLRTILCAPLWTTRGIVGVVYVDSRAITRRFTPEDVPLVEAFAAQAGAAIERVRLQQAELERDRMRRELEVAADIQRTFLPSAFPAVPGVDGAVRAIPAREVGGDVFDVRPLDGDRLALLVGDVSGKGVPGALFGARLLTDSRQAIRLDAPPGDVLADLGRTVHRRATRGMFVTAFLAVLHVPSGRLAFANAGHPAALVRRPGAAALGRLERPSGLPLGILPDTRYETGEATLGVGDVIVLLTDGLADAANAAGERFGAERVEAAIAAGPDEPGRLVDHLLTEVVRYTGAQPQADDQTLVAVRRQ